MSGARTVTLGVPVWAEMAEFLCGPLVGLSLLAELRARFPHARRDDVYQAIALAWTWQQAGWLGDVIELEQCRRHDGK
jgi:hypothetical protein